MLARLGFAFSLLCVLATGVTPAQAAWRVAEGIDVATGGAATLLIGDLDERTSLYARCIAGKPELFLDSYDGNDFELEPVGVVSLIISTDTGRSWTSPARYGREKSGYITTTWLSTETIGSVVAELMAAKAALSVSIEFEEVGATTWDTDAKGSTAAGKRFLQVCPASASAPAALPAAEPAVPAAWELTIEPDPVNGGQQATLVGNLDQGGYFYAFCDGWRQAEVAFLSSNPTTFPYEAGDVGLTLRVEIDGEQRSATGEHFTRTDGLVGIRYAAPEYLESLVTAVGAARSEVAMMIESYSTGMVTRWPAKNLVGLADGAARFVNHCFGTALAPQQAAPSPAQPVSPAPAPLPWELREVPHEADTDYVLAGDTIDNSGIVALSCSADGLAHVILTNSRPDALPVKPGDAFIDLLVEIDGQQWKTNAGYEISAEGTATLYSASRDDVQGIAQALKDGAAAMQVGVRNPDTDASLWSPVDLTNAAQAAAAFVPACFGAAADAGPAQREPTGLSGWQMLDEEASAERHSRFVVFAPTSPAAGRVELNCFDETGARQVAYYPDDMAEGKKLASASALELAVIVGDLTWILDDARFSVSAENYGVGSTDQEKLGEIQDALAMGPTEMTVSVQVDFGEWEPRKVPLGDTVPIALFTYACGR